MEGGNPSLHRVFEHLMNPEITELHSYLLMSYYMNCNTGL